MGERGILTVFVSSVRNLAFTLSEWAGCQIPNGRVPDEVYVEPIHSGYCVWRQHGSRKNRLDQEDLDVSAHGIWGGGLQIPA